MEIAMEFNVPDMSCGHCSGVITKTVQALDANATVSVDLPARAELGQAVATRLNVRNTGRRTSPLTTLTHAVTGLSDVTVVVDALPPGATAQVSVERTAVSRGRTRPAGRCW